MLLARDILDSSRSLIPDLRGEPYVDTPQLFFWSVAVASLPGGEVTERTAAGALVAARRGCSRAGGVIAALGVGAIFLVEGARYPERFARDFNLRPIAATAQGLTPPGPVVRVYPDIELSYDFYLRRPFGELDRAGIEQLLAGSASGAVIMSCKSWTVLPLGGSGT